MVKLPTSSTQKLPPDSPRDILPTMYDLPSEYPEENGLPDEFHDLQPNLLSLTCRPPNYWPQRMFTGTDLNVYYDVRHPLWHKRPDWFLAINVPRLYDQKDLRLSYVTWQEGVNPLVVVELLSPGTETEDLGETTKETSDTVELKNSEVSEVPPGKWQVYEQILRVPYYFVFSRYTDELKAFCLEGGTYQELNLNLQKPRIWIRELELGLGLWQGEYQGINRLWLRWYDSSGNWVRTPEEQALQEKDQALQEKDQALQEKKQALQEREKLAQKLRELGIDPDQID